MWRSLVVVVGLVCGARAARDISCRVVEVATEPEERKGAGRNFRCRDVATALTYSWAEPLDESRFGGAVIIHGAVLRADETVEVPASASAEYYAFGAQDEQGADGGADAEAVVGARTVLVLRVTMIDAVVPDDAATLARRWFGGFDDAANLVSQYAACSYGKLEFVPAIGNSNVVDGVAEVAIAASVLDGLPTYVVENLVTAAGTAVVGPLSAYDHVAYCLPPGVLNPDGEGWIGYAYYNNERSVYNGAWCSQLSLQMHEVGHNLNLNHAGQEGNEYGDQSGMMGYSYFGSETPLMCFNAAKSYDLGWYADRTLVVDDLVSSSSGPPHSLLLAGLADYGATTADHTVILKIDQASSSTSLYLTYNRAAGINQGTIEFINQVTVVEGGQPGTISISSAVGALSEGDAYRRPNFDNSGADLVVEFCALAVEPFQHAHLAVFLDDGSQGSRCGDIFPDEETAAPTPAPSPGSPRPTMGPTRRRQLPSPPTAEPTSFMPTTTVLDYECAEFDSDDCLTAYESGVRGGDLSAFLTQCATEGGANPLRSRCSKCCLPSSGAPTPQPTRRRQLPP